MTGPIIPADKWPTWADRHCWDEDGDGYFYGVVRSNRPERPGSGWLSAAERSCIPTPSGHDWRVPVMRPTAEQSIQARTPDIDLEQFRCHIERSKRYLAVCTDSSGGSSIARELADADRLLALIDGQKAAPRGPDQPDLCDLCRVREEVRSDAEGIPFCQECWDGWRASEQPTKGEGWPMADLDKMARELLAGELARDGWAGELAAVLLADRPDDARVPGNMALATIRAALLTAPAGWKLVPVEPTQEMLDEVCSSDGIEPWTDDVMASTYRAMIAAAPEVT